MQATQALLSSIAAADVTPVTTENLYRKAMCEIHQGAIAQGVPTSALLMGLSEGTEETGTRYALKLQALIFRFLSPWGSLALTIAGILQFKSWLTTAAQAVAGKLQWLGQLAGAGNGIFEKFFGIARNILFDGVAQPNPQMGLLAMETILATEIPLYTAVAGILSSGLPQGTVAAPALSPSSYSPPATGAPASTQFVSYTPQTGGLQPVSYQQPVYQQPVYQQPATTQPVAAAPATSGTSGTTAALITAGAGIVNTLLNAWLTDQQDGLTYDGLTYDNLQSRAERAAGLLESYAATRGMTPLSALPSFLSEAQARITNRARTATDQVGN